MSSSGNDKKKQRQSTHDNSSSSSQKTLIDLWFQPDEEDDDDVSLFNYYSNSKKSNGSGSKSSSSSKKNSTKSSALSSSSSKRSSNSSSSGNKSVSNTQPPKISISTLLEASTQQQSSKIQSPIKQSPTQKQSPKLSKKDNNSNRESLYSTGLELSNFFKNKNKRLVNEIDDGNDSNRVNNIEHQLKKNKVTNSPSLDLNCKDIIEINDDDIEGSLNIITSTTTTTTSNDSGSNNNNNKNSGNIIKEKDNEEKLDLFQDIDEDEFEGMEIFALNRTDSALTVDSLSQLQLGEKKEEKKPLINSNNNSNNINNKPTSQLAQPILSNKTISPKLNNFTPPLSLKTKSPTLQQQLNNLTPPSNIKTNKTPNSQKSQKSQDEDFTDYDFNFDTPSPLKKLNNSINNISTTSSGNNINNISSNNNNNNPTPSPTFSFISNKSQQQSFDNIEIESPSFDSPFKPKGINNTPIQFSPTPSFFSSNNSINNNNNNTQDKKNNLLKYFNESDISINSAEINSNNSNEKYKFERIVIVDIHYEVTLTNKNPIHKKTLFGYSETSKKDREMVLLEEWIFTPVKPGDICNIIGEFNQDSMIVINNQNNIIILHPDILITGTELGGSLSCSRRSLLKEQLRWNSKASTVPMFGSIVHEIFQECLKNNAFNLNDINRFKEEILKKANFQIGLSSLGETQDSSNTHIDPWIKTIDHWAKTFIKPKNISAKKNMIEIHGEKWHLEISNILDIEENIWSIMYGLKGKIDSSFEVKLTKDSSSSSSSNQSTFKKYRKSPKFKQKAKENQDKETICYLNVPFEIKTGKPYENPYISHTSQVLIYTLLMNDRYNQDIELGLLYYLKSQENKVGHNYGIIHPILFERNQIKSLLVGRNILAYFLNLNSRPLLKPNPILPNMLRDPFQCGKCYALEPCVLYHKAIEDGNEFTSNLGTLFLDKTNHLTNNHIDYLKKWNKIITLESDVKNNSRKLIWTRSVKFSESNGTCLGDLVLINEEFDQTSLSFIYTFQVNPDKLSNSLVAEGNYMIISIENKNCFGVGSGQISAIKYDTISIVCREKISEPPSLSNHFINHSSKYNKEIEYYGVQSKSKPIIHIEYENENLSINENRGLNNYLKIQKQQLLSLNNQLSPATTTSLTSTSISTTSTSTSTTSISTSPVLNSNNNNILKWRIDIDEQLSSLAIIKSNLFNLFFKENNRIRNLIVDYQVPSFSKIDQEYYSNSINFKQDYPHLNNDQINAIVKSLSCKDYSLILGMPGTGKTTTIVSLIHILWKMKKRIMVASFTHTSLDHLLIKVIEKYPEINDLLRLASSLNQVNPKIQKFCLENHTFNDITEIKNFLDQQTIVATTCLGINHPYFNSHTFDYCIIDEASQLSQPLTIGPLLLSKSFILVGDHYQLPPVVNNKEAGKLGLDISLFKILASKHPSSISNLYYQYRMSTDIMSISNKLVYNDRLKCGNKELESSKLIIKPSNSNISQIIQQESLLNTQVNWPLFVCNPNQSVVFINTDEIENSNESKLGDFYYNQVESNIVGILINCLNNHLGIQLNQIGIITPIRFQIKYIKNSIINYCQQFNSSINQNESLKRKQQFSLIESLDILTVDRFQGKDKDCIIISFVRSNDRNEIGELMKDWKRMNVAFTRAKKKLIFIGSKSTLESLPFFSDFFSLLNENNWVYHLKDYLNNYQINNK